MVPGLVAALLELARGLAYTLAVVAAGLAILSALVRLLKAVEGAGSS